MDTQNFGLLTTVNEYLELDLECFLRKLTDHHIVCMNMPVDHNQVQSWKDCHVHLQQQLSKLASASPHSGEWTIIFEYELPRERGRRPDVIILSNSNILVLEHKREASIVKAHLDQVSAYARDLINYHAGSHDNPVHPILFLTKSISLLEKNEDVLICSPDTLLDLIQILTTNDYAEKQIDSSKWVNSDYSPLPSLIQAARLIFQNEPLPKIKTAQSSGVYDTVSELIKISEDAKGKNEFHLALVTGVPGSGKTLVGLQFVYSNHFQDSKNGRHAVFLSGNGPLVKVLQNALRSPIFVQDVHGFLKQYGGYQKKIPEEDIWIFDEAQRAWDAEQVKNKRNNNYSEPEDFLRLAERKNEWSLIVGLIGEGQEIHTGEEAGIKQWNDAIFNLHKPWTVHCPSKISHFFTNAQNVITNDKLNLTISLRSHLARDVQIWVDYLLNGEINKAYESRQKILKQGFDMYVTRNIQSAKEYVCERYSDNHEKRYGLLASSKAKILSKYEIRNDYIYTRNLKVGPWYNEPPESNYSCCRFKEVATEFACQGLELDFPIIAWGDDLYWNESNWQSKPQFRSKARNPHKLRLNSYRVLLTRGRDGFIIFVPPEISMKPTYNALISAGILEL